MEHYRNYLLFIFLNCFIEIKEGIQEFHNVIVTIAYYHFSNYLKNNKR